MAIEKMDRETSLPPQPATFPEAIHYNTTRHSGGPTTCSWRSRCASTCSYSARRAVTYADDPRATTGAWAPVLNWGVFGKHMALLPTGKVLVWPTGQDARVWDPLTQTSVPVPALFGDLHCAAQTMLADGRVIVIGGQGNTIHDGLKITSLFEPFSNTWNSGHADDLRALVRHQHNSARRPILATSGDRRMARARTSRRSTTRRPIVGHK